MGLGKPELKGVSVGVPVTALYPYDNAEGESQCLGCRRGPSTWSERQIFTLLEPRPHIKLFAYAGCDAEDCRANIQALKTRDAMRYGTAQLFSVDQKCGACGQEGATSKCGTCKKARYCGKECQRKHWKEGHKLVCRKERDVEMEAKVAYHSTMLNEINKLVTGPIGDRLESWNRGEISREEVFSGEK